MEILYSIDAYQKTEEQAAKCFANEYWAAPREIESYKNNVFSMVDGMAQYEVKFILGKRFETRDIYQISKLAK